MKNLLTVVVILVVFAIAIMFGSQNDQLVQINYLLAMAEMPISNFMVLMLVLGAIISSCLWLWYVLKLKWRISSLERDRKKQLATES